MMKRIAIHSVPRSGSSWLGEIFNSSEKVLYKHQPLFSYAFKDRLSSTSSIKEIDHFFDDLACSNDNFIDRIDERNRGYCPVFLKDKTPDFIVYKEVRYHHILQNLLKEDPNIIVIGLIRNPLSVINSWLKAPKEFKREFGWEELEEWRYAYKKNLDKKEEFNGFEKWKEVSRLFENLKLQHPNRFYLLRYDKLLNDTVNVVKDLYNFCGIEFNPQTLNFIKKSGNTDQSDEAYSVFRKKQKDDKWKSELNPSIISEIRNDLIGTPLESYL